ncbi:sulfotransferase family protein [Pseudomonas citronellolis]|uniref:sulfotransferase family protein n=1 Tax=Pseudomonas citronellolis TaxID=53408 RepID=UPI0021C0D282|nr:sulfotransferase [Pseudomonas citronellolis]UXJ50284.1 sulfotransferase [Pseudomonas citronellolis]
MPAPHRFTGTEAQLHELASAATGLNDFGNDDYREGLAVLLRAFDTDLNFTPMGREFAWGSVISILAARLHTQEGWRQRPDCLGQPIRRPLVITGVPRTGTTALHKLLAMDPQFQGLEHWLTEVPMPRPPREQWANNPHYQRSVANLEAFFTAVPEMRAGHDIVAGEVDECLEVLKQSFVSNWFVGSFGVPSYDAWFQQQDERAAYRRYADVLRLIGADEPNKPWLLKNPGHIAELDVLLEVFPDACIVQTHRTPVKALPSLCSVLAMARRVTEGDAVDLSSVGQRESAYWRGALARTDSVRQNINGQVFDVDHRRFHTDPLGVVKDIYAFFGLTLDAEVQAHMRAWIAESPTTRHGEHRYSLEQFGLDAKQIRAEFADYIARFGLDEGK